MSDAEEDDSCSELFVNYYGDPIKFCIRICPEKAKLDRLIRSGYGELTSKHGPHTIRLLPQGEQIPISHGDSFRSQYIYDCVAEGKLLPLENYRAFPKSRFTKDIDVMDIMMGKHSWDECVKTDEKVETLISDFDDDDDDDDKKASTSSHKNSAKCAWKSRLYTQSERRAMLDYIIKHNRHNDVKGRSLWEEMEKAQVCGERTWQSMKQHYRTYIIKNLPAYKLPEKEARKLYLPFCSPKDIMQEDDDKEEELVVEIEDYDDEIEERNGTQKCVEKIRDKESGSKRSVEEHEGGVVEGCSRDECHSKCVASQLRRLNGTHTQTTKKALRNVKESMHAGEETGDQVEPPQQYKKQTGPPEQDKKQTGPPEQFKKQMGPPEQNKKQTGSPEKDKKQTGPPERNRSQVKSPEVHKQAVAPEEHKQAVAPEECKRQAVVHEEHRKQTVAPEEHRKQTAVPEEHRKQTAVPEEHRKQIAVPEEHRKQTVVPGEHRKQTVGSEEHKKQTVVPEEHRKQTGGSEEHRKQTGHSEEHKQTGHSEEHRKQTVVSEEHRKETVVPEEHRKETVVPEEHRKETVVPEEHRKETVVPEEHRKETVVPEEHRKETVVPEEHRKETVVPEEHRKETVVPEEHRKETVVPEEHRKQTGDSEEHRKETVVPEEHRKQTGDSEEHRQTVVSEEHKQTDGSEEHRQIGGSVEHRNQTGDLGEQSKQTGANREGSKQTSCIKEQNKHREPEKQSSGEGSKQTGTPLNELQQVQTIMLKNVINEDKLANVDVRKNNIVGKSSYRERKLCGLELEDSVQFVEDQQSHVEDRVSQLQRKSIRETKNGQTNKCNISVSGNDNAGQVSESGENNSGTLNLEYSQTRQTIDSSQGFNVIPTSGYFPGYSASFGDEIDGLLEDTSHSGLCTSGVLGRINRKNVPTSQGNDCTQGETNQKISEKECINDSTEELPVQHLTLWSKNEQSKPMVSLPMSEVTHLVHNMEDMNQDNCQTTQGPEMQSNIEMPPNVTVEEINEMQELLDGSCHIASTVNSGTRDYPSYTKNASVEPCLMSSCSEIFITCPSQHENDEHHIATSTPLTVVSSSGSASTVAIVDHNIPDRNLIRSFLVQDDASEEVVQKTSVVSRRGNSREEIVIESEEEIIDDSRGECKEGIIDNSREVILCKSKKKLLDEIEILDESTEKMSDDYKKIISAGSERDPSDQSRTEISGSSSEDSDASTLLFSQENDGRIDILHSNRNHTKNREPLKKSHKSFRNKSKDAGCNCIAQKKCSNSSAIKKMSRHETTRKPRVPFPHDTSDSEGADNIDKNIWKKNIHGKIKARLKSRESKIKMVQRKREVSPAADSSSESEIPILRSTQMTIKKNLAQAERPLVRKDTLKGSHDSCTAGPSRQKTHSSETDSSANVDSSSESNTVSRHEKRVTTFIDPYASKDSTSGRYDRTFHPKSGCKYGVKRQRNTLPAFRLNRAAINKESYNLKEDLEIIKYIDQRRAYYRVRGRELWQEMAKNNILSKRSWHGLKERFKKRIYPRLHCYLQFGVSENTMLRFMSKIPFEIQAEPARTEGEENRRRNYLHHEDRLIVDFIVKTRRYSEVGGRSLWQLMASKVSGLRGRTWLSLKERFRRHIINHLGSFNLSREEIENFQHPPGKFVISNGSHQSRLYFKIETRSSTEYSDQDADSDVSNKQKLHRKRENQERTEDDTERNDSNRQHSRNKRGKIEKVSKRLRNDEAKTCTNKGTSDEQSSSEGEDENDNRGKKLRNHTSRSPKAVVKNKVVKKRKLYNRDEMAQLTPRTPFNRSNFMRCTVECLKPNGMKNVNMSSEKQHRQSKVTKQMGDKTIKKNYGAPEAEKWNESDKEVNENSHSEHSASGDSENEITDKESNQSYHDEEDVSIVNIGADTVNSQHTHTNTPVRNEGLLSPGDNLSTGNMNDKSLPRLQVQAENNAVQSPKAVVVSKSGKKRKSCDQDGVEQLSELSPSSRGKSMRLVLERISPAKIESIQRSSEKQHKQTVIKQVSNKTVEKNHDALEMEKSGESDEEMNEHSHMTNKKVKFYCEENGKQGVSIADNGTHTLSAKYANKNKVLESKFLLRSRAVTSPERTRNDSLPCLKQLVTSSDSTKRSPPGRFTRVKNVKEFLETGNSSQSDIIVDDGTNSDTNKKAKKGSRKYSKKYVAKKQSSNQEKRSTRSMKTDTLPRTKLRKVFLHKKK
ncbi:uncharacterized protein [Cherax quadricarinatus]|uniref:uncharacterized protein isoform X2 n=1 Tax=Cherax quadricarinatus TaxID=27406 RepID=UPI0023782510|nr:uncharacterized protein LOC128684904 isoform X2 [Cherax quadricarinatus]